MSCNMSEQCPATPHSQINEGCLATCLHQQAHDVLQHRRTMSCNHTTRCWGTSFAPYCRPVTGFRPCWSKTLFLILWAVQHSLCAAQSRNNGAIITVKRTLNRSENHEGARHSTQLEKTGAPGHKPAIRAGETLFPRNTCRRPANPARPRTLLCNSAAIRVLTRLKLSALATCDKLTKQVSN